jgi:hypothetical protein
MTISMTNIIRRLARLEQVTAPPPTPNVVMVNGHLVVNGIILTELAQQLRERANEPPPTAAATAVDPESIEAQHRLRALLRSLLKYPHCAAGDDRGGTLPPPAVVRPRDGHTAE